MDRAQDPGTRHELFRGRPETLWPVGAGGPKADPSSQSWRGLPQVFVSMGSAMGPWLDYPGHACHQQLSKGRQDSGSTCPSPAPTVAQAEGGRSSLSGSQLLLLPAEDLCELAQLLAGGLGLLLQPLVVLAQAGHLRLQHRLVLLLLQVGVRASAECSPGPVGPGSAVV